MKLTNAHRLASPSRRALLASAMSVASFFPTAGTAQAQQAPTAETAADENSGEIIVTARRREERIQTVPIAITALSQEKLQDNNVATVGDIGRLVPSFSAYTLLDRDVVSVTLRGQQESNGRPGVVMYLNEIPVPSDLQGGGGLAGGPGLFFDLENVQVLKGPQGTLFGRESVGGSVLLQTARPKGEFGGHVQFGYGNYNNMEAEGAVNVPLIPEKLLTRVAFQIGKRDGFTHVLPTPQHPNGVDADNRDFWSVRGSVSFRPNDWFQSDTIITYNHFETNGSVPFLVDVNAPVALAVAVGSPLGGFQNLPAYFAQQQALGIRTHIGVDGGIGSRGTFLAISNATSFQLTDDLKLRTILGFDHSVQGRAIDNDGTPSPISNIPNTLRVNEQRQFTQEVQLLGKSFGGHLDWTLGAFALTVPFEPFVIQEGTARGIVNDEKRRTRTSSRALFAQGNYDLSELLNGLKFTAGIRYTWDRRTQMAATGGRGAKCTPPPNALCSNIVTVKPKSSALTWTLGLDYQVTPDTLIYLTSRKGYRAGGVNAVVGGVSAAYDPEFVIDYELGIKSDWKLAGRPLRVNADIYYQDYTNIQVTRTVELANAIRTITDNAAKARIFGGELEASWHITDNLEIGGTLSYLDLKFTKFESGVSAGTIRSIVAREKNSPKVQYGLNATYHLPFDPSIGDISVRANWNWQSKTVRSSGDLGSYPVRSFGLLNLAVHWDGIGGTPLDASLYMSNTMDKVYRLGGILVSNFIGYNTTFYGEPRMYGARLRYRFGGEEHR